MLLQTDTFNKKGLAAACVNVDQNNEAVLKGVKAGAYKLVYFTPEMLLLNKQWRGLFNSDIYTSNLRAFVIDEAHTVKKW